MKKLLALLLAVLMIFTFVACSSESDPSNKVEEYVETNEKSIISSVKKGIAIADSDCTHSIVADGNGFTVNINLNGMDNLSQEDRIGYQAGYNSLQTVFDGMVAEWRKDLPDLGCVKFNICEKDGDIIATIDIY